MIILPSDVLALIDEGRTNIRGLIRFEFGTGIYGFIKAIQPFVYGGLTYKPGGLINVSDLAGVIGLAAQQFTITLAASPQDGLTPAVLQTIEAEDYRDRPVIIMDAHFHPDTGAFLYAQTVRKGYVDIIRHLKNRASGYTIQASCETRAIDYTRTNGRKRSDLDQQRRSPGDGWFKNASTRGREKVYWGQDTPTTNAQALPNVIKSIGSKG